MTEKEEALSALAAGRNIELQKAYQEIQLLTAERNNLNSVAQTRFTEMEKLRKQLEIQKDISEALKKGLEAIHEALGLSAFEARINAIEDRLGDLNFDVREEFVEKVICNYMDDVFSIDEHLRNVVDWSEYVTEMDSEGVRSIVREELDGLNVRLEVL